MCALDLGGFDAITYRKNIKADSVVWMGRALQELSHIFSGFPAQGLSPTLGADSGRDIFDQLVMSVDVEYLVYCFFADSRSAADFALRHDQVLLLDKIDPQGLLNGLPIFLRHQCGAMYCAGNRDRLRVLAALSMRRHANLTPEAPWLQKRKFRLSMLPMPVRIAHLSKKSCS